MRDKFLTTMVGALLVVLAAALILPDRTISGFVTRCGKYIADLFGY